MQAFDKEGKPVGDTVPFDRKKMEKILSQRVVDHVKVFLLKKGMVLTIAGYKYKVTAVRPNGKITIRFGGLAKQKGTK